MDKLYNMSCVSVVQCKENENKHKQNNKKKYKIKKKNKNKGRIQIRQILIIRRRIRGKRRVSASRRIVTCVFEFMPRSHNELQFN